MGEEKYAEAMVPLQAVLDSDKFKPYEKAVAIQTMGFIYAGQGDYKMTLQTFERAIATGALPPRVVNDLTYNLAQLNLAEGKNRKALQLLEQWFANFEGDPPADAYGLKAQITPDAGRFARNRTGHPAKALSMVEAPKKNWTRILLSILLQQERYKDARPVLEDAVERWPGEKIFWQQLTVIYYDADDEKLAFVAQQAMFLVGHVDHIKELSSMAQLFLYHGVPIKAAQILDKGLEDGTIEKTEKNYELLANAFMHSREWKKAVKPLTIAAEKSDKGILRAIGAIYLQDEKWKEASNALEKALDKGGLDDEANTWLLLGIARTRIEAFDDAIKAFRKAGDDDVAGCVSLDSVD